MGLISPGGTGGGQVVEGAQTPADGYANPTDAVDVFSLGAVWNGATWDRVKSAGATGVVAVGGGVADAATDAGNPITVAGIYESTLPTYTTGQRGRVHVGSRGAVLAQITAADSTTGAGVIVNTGDGTAANTNALAASAFPKGYNGTSWDRLRTPNIFKTATATASGDSAVWTPAGGKKFRLMSYAIYVTANAAQSVAGLIEILLRDATTAIGVGYSIFVPGAAGTTFVDSSDSGWVQLGNGFLSGAADRVLNVNLSAALTAGEIRVVACGTEE